VGGLQKAEAAGKAAMARRALRGGVREGDDGDGDGEREKERVLNRNEQEAHVPV
jgi:hypothetical protein